MTGMMKNAYGHKPGDEAVQFYDEWADTYDDEVEGKGYASPARCAAALVEMGADVSAPLLDIGCGTGSTLRRR